MLDYLNRPFQKFREAGQGLKSTPHRKLGIGWPRSRALPTLASIGQICPPWPRWFPYIQLHYLVKKTNFRIFKTVRSAPESITLWIFCCPKTVRSAPEFHVGQSEVDFVGGLPKIHWEENYWVKIPPSTQWHYFIGSPFMQIPTYNSDQNPSLSGLLDSKWWAGNLYSKPLPRFPCFT